MKGIEVIDQRILFPNLTEEERKEKKREDNKRYRQNMTEEQKEKRKESNKRYLQNMTEEQKEERREYYKRRFQNRTEEQKNKTITPLLKRTPPKNTTKSKTHNFDHIPPSL